MSNPLHVIDEEFSEVPGGAMVRRSQALTPVQSIDDAVALREQIVEFTKRIMIPEKDFGVIPGTQKPTLLKAGAEKLCTHFALYDSFDVIEQTEDWMGKDHGGEPFFAYTVRCCLSRNGEVISQGVGHCNSWEKKYRYRSLYPEKATDEEKQRGKLVKRMGKNGKQYSVYLVPNEDIFDQVNTFLKMAKKRALIDATLRAVSASEFYTQDVEDIPPPMEPEPKPDTAPVEPQKTVAELFAEKAASFGFTRTKKDELRYLAKVLLVREPTNKDDYRACLDFSEDDWRKSVAQAESDIAEVSLPTQESGA